MPALHARMRAGLPAGQVQEILPASIRMQANDLAICFSSVVLACSVQGSGGKRQALKSPAQESANPIVPRSTEARN